MFGKMHEKAKNILQQWIFYISQIYPIFLMVFGLYKSKIY
jgi:hypothetical protein